jgi:hydrogenase-4 component B
MVWFLVALAIVLAGGVASLAANRSQMAASLAGAIGVVLGCGVVLVQSLKVLISGEAVSLHAAWPLPLASANMEIDPLSAVFTAAIAVVTMLAAIYGAQYLQTPGRKNLGVSWFFFNLLAASMLLVVVARNGVLFLVSWELMSLASFFLVTSDDQRESVRRAGWIYLVAMHLGTAFLLAMFLLLGSSANSLDFDRLVASPGMRDTIFLLAVIGFGTKAGFIPMHVWLPEAHPTAPSHVSAVMSGVMIKTGIYGILRTLTLLGEPPAWWGWTLIGIGVVSGILGVLYALSQHDLKRLLAYHSVENIGIIALGLGVGMLGISYHSPAMAVLGFTGGLLHVVNHAVFKSLLFLGAGSVLHSTGTGEIDRLGGLLKRMPTSGATFLVGAAAISGLPPLNGFVSEFLIYLGAVAGIGGQDGAAPAWPLMSVLVVGGLALIGGLAAACFTKAFGIAFLGEPRSDEAAQAHEVGAAMRWPMIALASLCVLIGLAAPLCPLGLQPAVAVIVKSHVPAATAIASQAVGPLTGVMFGSFILLGLIVLIAHVRRKLLAGRHVCETVTWDCGYAAPTPRMQYTSSSFARPIVTLFRLFLQPRDEIHPPRGLFPTHAGLHTAAPDLFRRYIYEPLFFGIAWIASKLRWLQEGRIQIYVLYIALTILVLLIWKLG